MRLSFLQEKSFQLVKTVQNCLATLDTSNQRGKLIEKKEGRHLNRFAEDRIWYWIPQKLI